MLSYEGTTVTSHEGVQPQPRNGRRWFLQYIVISQNNSMNTQTCIPKHAPKRETTPPVGSPKVFRRAAGPPPPQTPCNLPPGRRGHAADSQKLFFCLLPRAIPKQWELNIYKAVSVCLMFNPYLRRLTWGNAEVTADYTTQGSTSKAA